MGKGWGKTHLRWKNGLDSERSITDHWRIWPKSWISWDGRPPTARQLSWYSSQRAGRKRRIIHFGNHFIGVRDQLTRIFKNIIVLKDVINTAAAGTPPMAVACAGVTVSLLVKTTYCHFLLLNWTLANSSEALYPSGGATRQTLGGTGKSFILNSLSPYDGRFILQVWFECSWRFHGSIQRSLNIIALQGSRVSGSCALLPVEEFILSRF